MSDTNKFIFVLVVSTGEWGGLQFTGWFNPGHAESQPYVFPSCSLFVCQNCHAWNSLLGVNVAVPFQLIATMAFLWAPLLLFWL